MHFQLDEVSVPLTPFASWSEFELIKNGNPVDAAGGAGHFGTTAERTSANWAGIREAKEKVYRYALFADHFQNSLRSGAATTPGPDMVVTLGKWTTPGGTASEQAGTLMHELGHTLGLLHGGGDEINFKPNYFSVMNYHWQIPRNPLNLGWQLDYSRQAIATLNENALIEAAGVGFSAAEGFAARRVQVGPFPLQQVPLAGNVDWDRNGTLDPAPVSVDVNIGFADTNHDGFVNDADKTPGEILRGFDDWQNLQFVMTGFQKFSDGDKETPWSVEIDPKDLYDGAQSTGSTPATRVMIRPRKRFPSVPYPTSRNKMTISPKS